MPRVVRQKAQTFDDFSISWLAAIKLQVTPRTYQGYAIRSKTLASFFGSMRMDEIEVEHLEEYQQARFAPVQDERTGKMVQKMKNGVSINRELEVLRQMLKKAGKWEEIGPRYRPIKQRKDSPGKAASEQEERELLRVFYEAIEHIPQFMVAACADLISMNTTFGPGELRCLKLKDVKLDMNPPRIVLPERGAKRKSRVRAVPLNEHALFAVKKLVERAEKVCGCTSSDHYLIPFRPHKSHYDPTRPSGGWRYAHRELMNIAGVDMRMYDFRHHAVTSLLQNPNVSEEQVVQMAGWVNPVMLKTYSHVRIENLKNATDALAYRLNKPRLMKPAKQTATVEKFRSFKKRQAI